MFQRRAAASLVCTSRQVALSLRRRGIQSRLMATVRSSMSHEERTAHELRAKSIEQVTLSRIDQINDNIRLLRLSSVFNNNTIKVSRTLSIDMVESLTLYSQ